MLTVSCFNPRNLINLLRLTSRKSNPIRHDQCVRNRWDRLLYHNNNYNNKTVEVFNKLF